MILQKLIENIDCTVIKGSADAQVQAVQYDSRKVGKGDLFVCITGFQSDGHNYARSAAEKGASVIVAEHEVDVPDGVTVVIAENTRLALAQISAAYYDFPSEKINVIGVTGTNGKTTTTYLIKTILDNIGYKTGVVGTIGNMIGNRKLHADRTTPESLELQQLFSEMVDENVKYAVMEVSSHSLSLDRVAGVRYSTAIFTNLTQDHLDYHKTMENYMKAKGILFSMADKAVINMDDEAGEYMKSVSKGNVMTVGIDYEKADLRAENISVTADGVSYTLDYEGKQYPVKLNIPGRFSIYNSLGAIGACILNGIEMEKIIDGLALNEGVPGRFQSVPNDLGITAIVDYAHTPDGLKNILQTAHEFAKGRIITVFGCGGDRDRTKRPIMADIVGKLSDFAIITSDNPRTENPAAILDDVEVGMIPTKCPYHKIEDRREAINEAIKMAEKDDVVIIAGKGHEDYQIFADKTIHFDDVEEVKKAIEAARA